MTGIGMSCIRRREMPKLFSIASYFPVAHTRLWVPPAVRSLPCLLAGESHLDLFRHYFANIVVYHVLELCLKA